MAVNRQIAISQLQLDAENPRLNDGTQTQREAMKAMMIAQGDKLVALAKDIAQNGMSPLDKFLAIAADKTERDYIVLEGNRRLAAIKLLLDPDVAREHLSASAMRQLKSIAAINPLTADTKVECSLVESRDEAHHWLLLRHGGELAGAGTVGWGTPERTRFEERSGRKSPELKVMAFGVAHGLIAADRTQSISLTNLRRLLSDKHVRAALGIDIDRKSGEVNTAFPPEEVAKPIGKLLNDLAADDFAVANIYTKEDRAEYVKGFRGPHALSPATQRPAAAPLRAAADGVAPGTATASPAGKSTVAKRRATVAPTSLKLKISEPRMKEIFRELQRLKIDEHTNAGAVLLRVFLELTVDWYITKQRIPVIKDDTLSKKLLLVHNDLKQNGVMTHDELNPIRAMFNEKGLISASIPMFNKYVHCMHLSPSPSDVRTAWDNLERMFARIWV